MYIADTCCFTVCVQPDIQPIPPERPLVLLVQIDDYIPQELSTTPSTVCFPAMAKPTLMGIQRALVPLKRALNELEEGRARDSVAVLGQLYHGYPLDRPF